LPRGRTRCTPDKMIASISAFPPERTPASGRRRSSAATPIRSGRRDRQVAEGLGRWGRPDGKAVAAEGEPRSRGVFSSNPPLTGASRRDWLAPSPWATSRVRPGSLVCPRIRGTGRAFHGSYQDQAAEAISCPFGPRRFPRFCQTGTQLPSSETGRARPTATAAEYTASIDWGDGHTSAGTINGGAGSFAVSAPHTYAEEAATTYW
jgi:hypothetical protein